MDDEGAAIQVGDEQWNELVEEIEGQFGMWQENHRPDTLASVLRNMLTAMVVLADEHALHEHPHEIGDHEGI